MALAQIDGLGVRVNAYGAASTSNPLRRRVLLSMAQRAPLATPRCSLWPTAAACGVRRSSASISPTTTRPPAARRSCMGGRASKRRSRAVVRKGTLLAMQ